MTTIPEIFAALADSPRTAQQAALVGSYTVTFSELFDNAQARAAELRADGVVAGDVVAIVCYNEIALFEYLIAAGQLGAALVPLSPALPDNDLISLVETSGATVCYCSPAVGLDRISALDARSPFGLRTIGVPSPVGAPAVPIDFPPADSLCWLSTTGGSTGLPRLFATSHELLLANLFINAVEWGWTAHPFHLALAPLAHGIGFCNALGQLVTGGTVLLVEKYSAKAAVECLAPGGSTWTALVPTMLHDIIEFAEREDASSGHLGLVVSAGSSLASGLRDRAIQRGIRLIEYYGSTELGWVTMIEHRSGDPRDGLVGWPSIGATVRVVDSDGRPVTAGEIGRIERRGRNYTAPFERGMRTMTSGSSGQWETSGDLAYVDEDGAAVIVGREDDMIVIGGLNAYPIEIESVLRGHPSVVDAVVLGVEDERLGRTLVAWVEVRGAVGQSLEADLLARCAAALAGHKRPTAIRVVTALPRTASGKIDRRSASHVNRQ